MSAGFALALLSVDGLGQTTAHRLLDRFPTWDALRATPREQVRLRLKGTPRVDHLLDVILSDGFDTDHLTPARGTVDTLRQRGIHPIAPSSEAWPSGLNDLDRSDRPVVLYAYGHLDALARPALACLGRPPLSPDAFEASQALARHALAMGAGLVVGAQSGFDVALQKLSLGANRGAVAVLNCGLAKLETSLRPAATALTRGGGLLLSPFPMTHGPFDHDDRERAHVQAALGRAVSVVGATDGSPEQRASAWADAAARPVASPDGTAAPEAVWATLWPGAS
ncbi:MAG: DNA-processing protein DprA [Bacteroidota bacterium]